MQSPADAIGNAPPAAARARVWRIVERVLLAAGLVLLAGLVRRLGGAALVANLRLVGWGIALIVGQEILAVLANTLGWRAAFPSERPPPPFGQLLAARIAGDAVNYVTPTATLGGEFARARVLQGRASRVDLATSIAVAKVSQTVAQAVFIGTGLVFVLTTVPLSGAVRLGLVTGTAMLSALVFAVVVAQRRGMFVPLARLLTSLDRRGRLVDVGERMQRLDVEIARVHLADRRPFLTSCTWFFLGWTLGTVEIALMLWLLGMRVSFERVLAIEVLSVAIDATLFFVPGKLGTQEGGKVLIFTALGLDAVQGLSVGVLRRIRELAWALAGLLILARFQLPEGVRTEPAAAPPARQPAD
ncbi:MAG: flippase-like domain-containing protein [Deltaproteobacteria bacterium]|nr:flippase-like domain-containing protein [Deltaproteobacteria bacterium]